LDKLLEFSRVDKEDNLLDAVQMLTGSNTHIDRNKLSDFRLNHIAYFSPNPSRYYSQNHADKDQSHYQDENRFIKIVLKIGGHTVTVFGH
jgi:hypothetical protein